VSWTFRRGEWHGPKAALRDPISGKKRATNGFATNRAAHQILNADRVALCTWPFSNSQPESRGHGAFRGSHVCGNSGAPHWQPRGQPVPTEWNRLLSEITASAGSPPRFSVTKEYFHSHRAGIATAIRPDKI